MKLLLILIITALMNIANGQNCFTNSYAGATLNYRSSGVNNNARTEQGIQGFSNLSNGTVSADLKNGVFFLSTDDIQQSNFNDQVNTYSSQVWGFEESSTIYILTQGECYTSAFTFVIPLNQVPQLTKVGTTAIGTLDVTIYEVANPESEDFTTITVLVNEDDCSLVSGQTQNAGNYSPGGSVINFYNYVAQPNPSLFNLPSVCANAQPLPTNSKSHMKTVSQAMTLLNFV